MRTKVPELYRLLNEYCVHVQPHNGAFLVCRMGHTRIISRSRILNTIYIFYSAVR